MPGILVKAAGNGPVRLSSTGKYYEGVFARVAYLRVYLDEGRLTDTVGRRREPLDQVDLSTFGLLSPDSLGKDLEAEWSGRRLVCPNNGGLRVLEGLLAFHNAYQAMGGSMIVPEAIARLAAEELERLYSAGENARSHILTSAWYVPLRWFVPFDPSTREIIEVAGVTGIRYRTDLLSARLRLERALNALREIGMDEAVIGQVDELSMWLEAFESDSMVELDYGTVAGMFNETDIILDETASEVASSIEALERGDLDGAGEHYASAAARWAPAMAVTFSN